MGNSHSGGDKLLINKLRNIVLANLSNEHFDVEALAREAGMSRSTLHRKLKQLKNQNVSQFIRETRLHRARELLQEHNFSVSEISYQVGFGSPAYFNKCFHAYFGSTPGEIKKRVVDHPSLLTRMMRFPKTMKLPKKYLLIMGWAAIILLTWAVYNYLAFGTLGFKGSSHHEKNHSVMVLPFKNLSENPENMYIADGLTEDILNTLFHISDLRILSRTTSEHFLESGLTAKEIARQVNARNLLEGSIRQHGKKIRISVQLIDAYRDEHLWSTNFDRDTSDIMDIQGDIAMQVALKLNAVISESEADKIRQRSTNSPEAYDYYLKGRFLLHKATTDQRYDFNKEGVTGCIRYFEKAIEADPDFAEAYAGLANAWFNLSAWGIIGRKKGFSKSLEFSKKALEIDPDCAEAHTIKSAYYIWGGPRQFEKGREEVQTALKLNPNFPYAQQIYTQLLMITGPIEEARLHMDYLLELEPYFWVVQNLNAWVYYFEEKYDKGIDACMVARDLKPGFIENKWLFFLNYAKTDRDKEALDALLSILQSHPAAQSYTREAEEVFQQSGIKGLFEWLIDVNIHKPVPVTGMDGNPFFPAWWNAILGNRDEAIFWLEENIDHPFRLAHYLNLITTNPDFDCLRDDPRFLAIVAELGLTPYHSRTGETCIQELTQQRHDYCMQVPQGHLNR
jgi:TolB-like protein/AraC-like DNA-binding protein